MWLRSPLLLTSPQCGDTKLKNVLLIGLDPSEVNDERWPGLTAENLEAGLRRDQSTSNDEGYKAHLCSIDLGEARALRVCS